MENGSMKKLPLIFVSAGLALVSLTGCEKYRLDAEVRQLCTKDGGIKVYEPVKLPPDKFDHYGNVKINSKNDMSESDEYYYVRKIAYLQKGDPEIWQTHVVIIRRTDEKVLGESIRYTRRGGDIPGPWHPSSFICPDINEASPSLEKSIFIKGSEK